MPAAALAVHNSMADATTTEQAAAAATPADSAPEPSRSAKAAEQAPEPKGRKILEQAKADLKALHADQRPPPAEPAPDPAATPPESTPGPEEDKGSRREQGQRLREQIRKEVKAEFEADQQAAHRRQQDEQQQREFDELVQRADGGDWEAKDRVLQILKGNRGMSAAIAQGRNAVLEEMGRDISQAVYKLDGLDDDGQQALMKAPSVAEFGKAAFEQGRKTERTVHEGTIATLKAENESLKGRLAGSGPSPTGSNGQVSNTSPPTRFKSMHDAFAAAQAELGYRAGSR